jgi:type II restriction/modification system DNA methylase subunit YeeA
MFQGVMDKDQRRELGAHYTSEENILKLINSLFMDELWQEYDRVKTDPVQLDHFHDKISRLKFLDPACGCGNFLIITYRELRILELELLKMKVGTNQLTLDISHLLKVTVEQFYGIEYEDFPCQIAQVGMWLMDHQMNIRAAEQFGMYYARLPLTQSATIVNGNALTIDWESVVPKHELSYILGNPPFVGARVMSEVQKADMLSVFDNTKGVGNLDYVTAWYKKAAELMQNTTIKTAFVSTNSITQGEQVSILWKPLIEEHNVRPHAERTHYCDSLLLPAGQLRRVGRRPVRQPNARKQFHCIACCIFFFKIHPAGCRLFEQIQAAQKGAFSRPGRAYNNHNLALVYLGGNIF